MRCSSSARWSVLTRAMRVMARSACAAPVGSSLGRSTFLLALSCSCSFESWDWRVVSWRTALS
ncbi:hypothetical protein [Variovorax sp. UC122_21]|uniref:hypothetical protein n=1 Tax=Variovorax sp. UC122_21 TaxID=3374554 RepID=UPI003757CC47